MTRDENAASVEFWAWFLDNVRVIESLYEAVETGDQKIFTTIDRRLQTIGPNLRWEIGPDELGGLYFALSLLGRREALARNNAIMRSAPSVSGWHFYPSRPRKLWQRRLIFGGREIDFNGWRFRRVDRNVEFTPSLADRHHFTDSYLEGACWVFLEHELGELKALTITDDVHLRPQETTGLLEPARFAERESPPPH